MKVISWDNLIHNVCYCILLNTMPDNMKLLSNICYENNRYFCRQGLSFCLNYQKIYLTRHNSTFDRLFS